VLGDVRNENDTHTHTHDAGCQKCKKQGLVNFINARREHAFIDGTTGVRHRSPSSTTMALETNKPAFAQHGDIESHDDVLVVLHFCQSSGLCLNHRVPSCLAIRHAHISTLISHTWALGCPQMHTVSETSADHDGS
jgi:hypothetical protein